MASGATPQLRVVQDCFANPGAGRDGRSAITSLALPGVQAGAAARPLARGVEALARLSFSRVDESPTPWEEGTPAAEAARVRGQRIASAKAEPQFLEREDVSDMLSFANNPGNNPRSTIAWSGPSSRSGESQGLESVGENSNISLIRKMTRLATPVLEVADALRALRLNQVRLSDGMTLKLDGRTGRHARCFAILTQRF